MASSIPIELRRHYAELSEVETEELVAAVADLIVDFLKGSRESAQAPSTGVATVTPEVPS